MAKRPQWKKDMDEFARAYENYHLVVCARVENKSVAELRRLAAVDRRVTITNCGWSTYAAAEEVAAEARRELYRRKQQEAASG